MTRRSGHRPTALFPLLLIVLPSAVHAQLGTRTEPVVGLPCEGCEGVFEGLPDAFESVSRLAPEGEPGEPMRIRGTVFDADGSPVPGVIVYAYQTDARGVYPPEDGSRGWTRRHGRLRGWAITDAEGRYGFETIRPSSYPDSEVPAHVHMHVIEPGCCTYYIDDIQFDDDPRLTERERAESNRGRGGSGLVVPERAPGGPWLVTRDIRLGERIPGYEAARGADPSI